MAPTGMGHKPHPAGQPCPRNNQEKRNKARIKTLLKILRIHKQLKTPKIPNKHSKHATQTQQT